MLYALPNATPIVNMNQDKIVKRISDLWEEGMQNENTIIEKLQTEFQISANEAETTLELTQSGFFRASFIISGKKYPENNLDNHPIVKAALKLALSNLGRPDLYIESVKQNPWWKFWNAINL